MIAILLAAAFAQVAPPPAPATASGFSLDAIGRQSLPRSGCAAYLWNKDNRRLVAMAGADAATLRLSIDGKTIDLARTGQEGTLSLGFGTTMTYAADGVTAKLDMTIVPRENLVGGAQVPDGALAVTRAGSDTIVVPVAGLVGCTA